jgi:gentisate 1,2-dioxygenase
MWGSPGIRPTQVQWSKKYSPLYKYEWAATYRGLLGHAQATDGSPFDGTIFNYVNPATGGHVMPTMGASIQRLMPGQHTKAHRHTGSFIYQVAKGRGHSIIDNRRLDWQERDIFCLPSWAWHEHINGSSTEDACLFSFHDLPVIESLGLYREQAYEESNGQQTCN